MSLLFGDVNALQDWPEFWDYVHDGAHSRARDEWLQAYPNDLNREVSSQLGFIQNDLAIVESNHTAEKHTRVNFQFDRRRYSQSVTNERINCSYRDIIRTGSKEYDVFNGSVIPRYFWRNREAFLKEGVGFSLRIDGVVVSTAFSAFIHGSQLELGIETASAHQGKGYAFQVCSELIGFCLANGYEPVWSCRLENSGSVRLAGKRGFQPTLHVPYFKLKGIASKKSAG